MKKFGLYASLVLVVVALVGCRGKGEVRSVERQDDGSVNVTVAIDEAGINGAIDEALTNNGNPLLRDPEITLLGNNQVYVEGQHDKRDGSERVSGNLTVQLSVQEGAILAQIVAVNIEGVDLSDTRIQNFNQRLANGLTVRANKENRQITVLSLDVSTTEVVIEFNYKRNMNN